MALGIPAELRAHLPFRGLHLLVTHAPLARAWLGIALPRPFGPGIGVPPTSQSSQPMLEGPLELAYLAGLFDGEGFVRIDSHHMNSSTGRTPAHIRYCIHAGLAMTYMPAVRLLHERFGGFYKGDDSFQRRYPKNRVIYRWSVTSMKAFAFLLAIEPYTFVKREQIEIAIAFQRHVLLHKPKMLGCWKAAGGLANQEAFKARVFAERAAMCERIRLLKKEDFPLSHK